MKTRPDSVERTARDILADLSRQTAKVQDQRLEVLRTLQGALAWDQWTAKEREDLAACERVVKGDL